MTAPRSTIDPFDPTWPSLLINPYPTYRYYRESDPVHWGLASNPMLPGSWYVFRYEDSARVLSDHRLKSNPASVGMADAVPIEFAPVAHVFQELLGALDPPKHTRVRAAMGKAFTSRRVAELRTGIEALTHELLTEAMRSGEPFELVSSFAFPLPMSVIGNMLGIAPGDREQFRTWSSTFAQAVDDPRDSKLAAAGSHSALEMLGFFREQLIARRRRPTDDLLTAMMAAVDDDGLSMSEFELLPLAIELVVAGHETTVTGLTKAIHGMIDTGIYAGVAARFAADAATFGDDATEEVLRWTSPAQRQRSRWVTEPMELGGRRLERGQSVVVMLGAANRDPAQFPDPDALDFHRSRARHLAFGVGPHFCLGAALARLEIGTALRVLLTLAPDLALSSREILWRRNAIIPGPASLFVERKAQN